MSIIIFSRGFFRNKPGANTVLIRWKLILVANQISRNTTTLGTNNFFINILFPLKLGCYGKILTFEWWNVLSLIMTTPWQDMQYRFFCLHDLQISCLLHVLCTCVRKLRALFAPRSKCARSQQLWLVSLLVEQVWIITVMQRAKWMFYRASSAPVHNSSRKRSRLWRKYFSFQTLTTTASRHNKKPDQWSGESNISLVSFSVTIF